MKELDNIRDKQQLYRLYAKQYSQRKIRQTINNIIQYYRPFCSNKCHRISNQEALMDTPSTPTKQQPYNT